MYLFYSYLFTEDRAGPFQISGRKKWKNLKITRKGPYIESVTALPDYDEESQEFPVFVGLQNGTSSN